MAANPKKNAGHDNPILPVASSSLDMDSFKLVAETRKHLSELADFAKDAIKAHYNDPELLASFIESHQTQVYCLQGSLLSSFGLWVLGFEPGFIAPVKGLRYRLLQHFLRFQAQFHWRMSFHQHQSHQKDKQGEKTDCHFRHGVFVLTRPLFTVGFISHQLHHWLAFRSGMQGYSERSQKLYRKFWSKGNGTLGQEVYKMKAIDMMDLKSAISRDLEALQFLKSIADEILIPAQQARYISAGNASA